MVTSVGEGPCTSISTSSIASTSGPESIRNLPGMVQVITAPPLSCSHYSSGLTPRLGWGLTVDGDDRPAARDGLGFPEGHHHSVTIVGAATKTLLDLLLALDLNVT